MRVRGALWASALPLIWTILAGTFALGGDDAPTLLQPAPVLRTVAVGWHILESPPPPDTEVVATGDDEPAPEANVRTPRPCVVGERLDAPDAPPSRAARHEPPPPAPQNPPGPAPGTFPD